jgi:carboxymethylenebutenolidase
MDCDRQAYTWHCNASRAARDAGALFNISPPHAAGAVAFAEPHVMPYSGEGFRSMCRMRPHRGHRMQRKKASDVPQELLTLFDGYVHGRMGRRDFLAGAQKFAVGGVTAAALFEMLKPNYALAVQVPPDDKRITAQYYTLPSTQGNGSIKGYLVRPANATKLPAVLVIHENRGLNPYIEDVARRLAVANFIAFAPDALTSLGGYPGDDEKALELFRQVDAAKMREDFFAAATWLKSRRDCTGKIGAIGFCFGGGVVNQLAVRMGSDLAAGVPFYGAQPNAADAARIKAPINAQYGELDARITDGWPAFDAALTEAHVPHEAHVYKAANHGFHNDTTPRYDEAAAKEAWQHSLDWFNKYLRG